MLEFIELLIALSIIVVVLPQTPKPTENIVLRKLLQIGLFPTYIETKQFLNWLTWFLIFLFLLLLIVLNLKVV